MLEKGYGKLQYEYAGNERVFFVQAKDKALRTSTGAFIRRERNL